MSLEAVIKKYRDIINPEREYPTISLGPVSLNILVSGNTEGIQGGKMIQVVGREGSGKTTLCADMCAQFLRRYDSDFVVWLDVERSADPAYFSACGVDMQRFIRITPDNAEDGFEAVRDFIDDGGVRLVVIDSVAFIIPKANADKRFGESQRLAAAATLLTDFCKRMTPLIDNRGATIVFINQMRKNINPMSPVDEIPFGANALQHASSLTIHLTRIKRIENVGQITQALVSKSRGQGLFSRTEFLIRLGSGIDHADNIIQTAKDLGIITISGSWLTYKDKKVQGAENAAKQFPLGDIVQDIQSHLRKECV